MATISINIPNDKATEVLDAISEAYGWNAELGVTKPLFAKRILADFIKGVYISHAAKKVADAAQEAFINQAKNIDIN